MAEGKVIQVGEVSSDLVQEEIQVATPAPTPESEVESPEVKEPEVPKTFEIRGKTYRKTDFQTEWTTEQDEVAMSIMAEILPSVSGMDDQAEALNKTAELFKIAVEKKLLARLLAVFYVEEGTDWDGDHLDEYEQTMRKAKGANLMIRGAIGDFFAIAGIFSTGSSPTSSVTI